MNRPPPPPRAEWAYFFDIDGTLADLAASPDAARISPDLLARVSALVATTGGAVAMVSGRALRDIDALFDPAHIPAAGQHGAERRSADGHLSHVALDSAALDAARARLGPLVRRHLGLLLEDKGSALALHYRAVPRLGAFAHRIMRDEQRLHRASLSLQSGKRVVELVPAAAGKGAAIAAFMDEAPFLGRLPVFLGDDVTDEGAFATVDASGGHSVKVGPGPSAARWRLAGVDAVHDWLSHPAPSWAGEGSA